MVFANQHLETKVIWNDTSLVELVESFYNTTSRPSCVQQVREFFEIN